MSERSHPRFAGLQMTIFKTRDPPRPGERTKAVLHLNDIPIEVTPAPKVARPTDSRPLPYDPHAGTDSAIAQMTSCFEKQPYLRDKALVQRPPHE
jgi:hypothetical protein